MITAYEWGVRETWAPEYGASIFVRPCVSEHEARSRVEYFEIQRRDGAASRIASMTVVRRPLTGWEDA